LGSAGLAQLVEQRIRNAKVGGSTPLPGTRNINNLRYFQSSKHRFSCGV
jgi:hypothetical protein